MAQAAAPYSAVVRRENALPLAGASFWRNAGWLSLLAILTGVACLIYLIATSSVLSAGYEIQRLERERSEWQAKNEQLRLELAKVRSLAWIEAQSTTRLGMVRPENVRYVYLDQPLAAAQPPATTAPAPGHSEALPDAGLSGAVSQVDRGPR